MKQTAQERKLLQSYSFLRLTCDASFVLSPFPYRNLALEQRMATVEESIEKAGAQLTQIVTAAKVPKHLLVSL